MAPVEYVYMYGWILTKTNNNHTAMPARSHIMHEWALRPDPDTTTATSPLRLFLRVFSDQYLSITQLVHEHLGLQREVEAHIQSSPPGYWIEDSHNMRMEVLEVERGLERLIWGANYSARTH